MKKVLIYGVYDSDNLGDDFMMYQIKQKLEKSEIEPIFLDNKNKKNYFNIDGVKYLQFPFGEKDKDKIKKGFNIIFCSITKKVLKDKDLKDIDSIIFMGGGYTNEDFGFKNLLRIYFLCKMFKSMNKNIYFTGQTVGPVKSKKSKIIIKKIYEMGKFVFVREKYSKDYLDSIGISNDLIGDDAFLAIENNIQLDYLTNKGYIIYNYKDFDGYSDYESEYFSFLNNVAKKMNKKIIVIPFRSNKNSNEYKINYKLYKYLKENNVDVDFIVEKDINKFCELFNNAQFVIGTAYHSIVLGLMFGNISYSAYIGEYYKMKINGIMDWYNLSQTNCVDLTQISNVSEEFVNAIINNSNNLDKQLKNTNRIVSNIKNAWNKIINDIKKGDP